MGEESISIDDIDNSEAELGTGLIPPPPQAQVESGQPFTPHNVQAVRGASQLEAQHAKIVAEAQRTNRAIVPMPNGELQLMEDDGEYNGEYGFLSGKHEALVGDALRLIANPTPGWIYVWAAKYTPKGERPNPMTIANIRAKRYVPIAVELLKEDCDAPVESHKIAGKDCAGLIDVVLMGVPPAAQKQLFKWRTYEAKRKTVRWSAFDTLNQAVRGASGGQAFAQVERKD